MAMSVSETPAYEGTLVEAYDVLATESADTGDLEVIHSLGLEPDLVFLTPLSAAARLSDWSLKSKDADKAVVTKNGTTRNSGNAAAQLRVTVMKLHSIVR